LLLRRDATFQRRRSRRAAHRRRLGRRRRREIGDAGPQLAGRGPQWLLELPPRLRVKRVILLIGASANHLQRPRSVLRRAVIWVVVLVGCKAELGTSDQDQTVDAATLQQQRDASDSDAPNAGPDGGVGMPDSGGGPVAPAA